MNNGPGKVLEKALVGDRRFERELILRCARTCVDPESAARIKKLLQEDIDWMYTLDAARKHGVMPLLYLSLRDAYQDLVPDAVQHQLRREFLVMGFLVHRLIDELLELLNLFEAHGISALTFKGPALAVFAYGRPERRKPGDLDILIHKRDLLKASDILIDRGYQPAIPLEEIQHHIEKKNGVSFYQPAAKVDLHWTLDDFPFSVKLDLDQIWKQSTTVPLGGAFVRSLSTEDLLHYLCLHGAKHNWVRLHWICDIANLIHKYPDLDWQHIMQRARRLRVERMLYLGLLLACELLGASLPDEVQQRLRHKPKVASLALQVGGWLFESPSRNEITSFRMVVLERLWEKGAYLLHRWNQKTHVQPVTP